MGSGFERRGGCKPPLLGLASVQNRIHAGAILIHLRCYRWRCIMARIMKRHPAWRSAATLAFPLPVGCREVRELFTGQLVPVTGRQFRHTFKTPDTAMFELIRQSPREGKR
jgi:hypothetical protein